MGDARSLSSVPYAAPLAGRTDVRAAIARAAQATGMDFDYLLAQAKLESSLDPSARAATSSAAGLYQFTRSTWLATLDRHGADHGLGWAEAAIEGGKVRDPAMRDHVMALRLDANASALMAAELARDNREALRGVLGREPDSAELYLAHFLGAGGAGKFLSAMSADPQQSAAALMPQAAAANRTIFHDRSGAPRSLAGVMELMRTKVAGAMEGGTPDFDFTADLAPWSQSDSSPPEFEPVRAAAQTAPFQTSPFQTSMADTLRDAFGLASASGTASAPDHVRTAYGQLRALGL